MARAYNKKVQPRYFKVGQLVLKRIFPHQVEAKGKFSPRQGSARELSKISSSLSLQTQNLHYDDDDNDELQLHRELMPKNIAIIMDGNRRWAKAKGLPVHEGHKLITPKLKEICDVSSKLGIQVITAFAFSTENWKRSTRIHITLDLWESSASNPTSNSLILEFSLEQKLSSEYSIDEKQERKRNCKKPEGRQLSPTTVAKPTTTTPPPPLTAVNQLTATSNSLLLIAFRRTTSPHPRANRSHATLPVSSAPNDGNSNANHRQNPRCCRCLPPERHEIVSAALLAKSIEQPPAASSPPHRSSQLISKRNRILDGFLKSISSTTSIESGDDKHYFGDINTIPATATLFRRPISTTDCRNPATLSSTKARDVDGYKLWYSGSVRHRNGVGILVDEKLGEQVVEVKRVSDKLMSIKLVIGGSTVNVISVYAPQVGLEEKEKKEFWEVLDEVVRSILSNKNLLVEGDFNGHIRSLPRGFEDVHGGFGLKERNEGESALLDFSGAFGLWIANSNFPKKEEHLIMFCSSMAKTHRLFAS
ncbi:Dimethylallylcistransferase, chloroplastic [Capsicum annuum]|nr:Dimethylallylcistransferase, chloroplastic [Capsicum annuum]